MKKEIVFDDPYLRKNLMNDEDNTLYNIEYHYEYIKNIYFFFTHGTPPIFFFLQ